MNPILIVAVLLILAAGAIAFRVISPALRTQRDSSTQGLNDAKKKVVDSTTRLVEKRGGNSLQGLLEKSGSQLRSGEWVLIVIAITVALSGLAFLLLEARADNAGLPGAIMLMIATPIIARALLKRNIRKRQEAFANQLPDFLQNLSSALRSGQSLPQSIASIAPDMESPAGDELRRVVIENRIGRDLVDSFNDLARRMDSIDFDWVVRAVEINYRTGGDLSVILRRLDATIRARNHVAGTVQSLTAEGRISGVILSGLPPGLMLAVQFINPGFLDPLFHTPMGRLLLAGAALQLCIGSIWLSRMARFKY